MDVRFSSAFRKGAKRFSKNPKAVALINRAIRLFAEDQPLPASWREHALRGDYAGFLECHLAPDLLLVYRREADCVILAYIGSHSELF